MNTYGFTVAHGYEILKGVVDAENGQMAKEKILNKDWNDVLDTYDCDEFTEGYEILEMWEAD